MGFTPVPAFFHSATRRLSVASTIAFFLSAPAWLHAAEPSATSLADIRNVFIDFQTDADVGDCRARLTLGLKAIHINPVETPENADSSLRMRLIEKESIRKSLNWHAAIHGTRDQRIYTDDGNESGWSLDDACADLVEDFTEDLGEDLERARQFSSMRN